MNDQIDEKLVSKKNLVSQPALVTCTVNDHRKVTFEIDTGPLATCGLYQGYRRQKMYADQPNQNLPHHAQ